MCECCSVQFCVGVTLRYILVEWNGRFSCEVKERKEGRKDGRKGGRVGRKEERKEGKRERWEGGSIIVISNSGVQYCIMTAALYCTVLYCTVLYCTVLYCTVLYCS